MALFWNSSLVSADRRVTVSSRTLVTTPKMPEEVMTLSPTLSALRRSDCSFAFFCWGRRTMTYITTSMKTTRPNWVRPCLLASSPDAFGDGAMAKSIENTKCVISATKEGNTRRTAVIGKLPLSQVEQQQSQSPLFRVFHGQRKPGYFALIVARSRG